MSLHLNFIWNFLKLNLIKHLFSIRLNYFLLLDDRPDKFGRFTNFNILIMRLLTGTNAPSLIAIDSMGCPVDLQALRGRRVMLSFYRYASCPICNMRMRELILAHSRLQAAGLELVSVFQSRAESITQYVGRQDAPFPIIADPEMTFYRRFGVESRWGGMFSLGVIRAAVTAFGKGFFPGKVDGPLHRVPADFLIDADGKIAIAHYGKTIDDHLTLATIEQWLQATK